MTTDYDPTHLDTDVKRFLELKAKAEDLAIEMEAIRARLRDNLPPGPTAAPCGVTVTVTPQRRFSADKAAAIVPEPLLALCRVTVVDSKAAKASLPPALYSACAIEMGAPRVVVT